MPHSSKYTVKITEGEFKELQSLFDMNILAQYEVVMKVLEQIVKDEELDNYDTDGTKPEYHAPEFNTRAQTEDPYD